MTRINAAAPLALALALAAGCEEAAPDDPRWVDDVRPIMVANCVRCHGFPATGGAPRNFRLDVCDATSDVNGVTIWGAKTMATFVALRAGEVGDMPPDYPRTDGQRDTLINWTESTAADGCLRRPGERPGNRPPALTLLEGLPATADASASFEYQIDNPDGDVVTGELAVAGSPVPLLIEVHSGRGRVTLDTSVFPPGTYEVTAAVRDDGTADSTVNVPVGQLVVDHPGGNTAPAVRIDAPTAVDILADVDSPFSVTACINDPDQADALSVDFTAVRGAEEIPIEADVAPAGPCAFGSGVQATAAWDTTAVPAGSGWRVRVTASDGTATTAALSPSFVVGHATTDVEFGDPQVLGFFTGYCGACHPGLATDVPHNFREPGEVYALRGLIFDMVVEQRTMPPESARALGVTLPGDDELAILAEWFLAGSPGARP